MDANPIPSKRHSTPACEVVGVTPNGSIWKFFRILVVGLPPLGVLVAMVLGWRGWFRPVDLVIFSFLYLVTGFGITIGFHRLFTHRSFQASPLTIWGLGIAGSMAIEGPLAWWVATHRRHHQHSDEESDPHSPHLHRRPGIAGAVSAFFHSHLGWTFRKDCTDTDLRRYAPDILGDQRLMIIHRFFPLWVILGLILPAAFGWLAEPNSRGAFLGFLWGGLVRVFMVHHVTWSVNSVCHIWGLQDHETGDESRNNLLFGVLALGEGWHNNHHAFPSSARHGLEWWQLDFSWLLIRILAVLGLAREVKSATSKRSSPSAQHVARP
jgi:stearoyl-CoA desaturase (delta-9 desaturase)